MGLHPHTVRKLCDEGRLRHVRVGNQRYIDAEEIDNFKGGKTIDEAQRLFSNLKIETKRDSEELKNQLFSAWVNTFVSSPDTWQKTPYEKALPEFNEFAFRMGIEFKELLKMLR